MKRKLIILLLTAIIAVNMASCGNSDNTDAYVTRTPDKTETKVPEETMAPQETAAETKEADSVAEQTHENTKDQETRPSATIDQNTVAETDSSAATVEKTTEAQTEKITQPQIYNVQPNVYPNTFSLITSAREYPGGLTEYMTFLKNSGATEVASTSQAVSLLGSTCAKAVNGLNICFTSDSEGDAVVDVETVMAGLPKDTEIGKYIDGNIYEYQTRYTSNYFGVKLTWWTTEAEENALNLRVSQVIATFSGTTYDKIKAAHDYVCNSTDYCYETYAGRDNNYSAYDALFGGKAVCQGYALAFQKFMDKLQIPSYIAKGVIYSNGTTEPHAWNIVQLDGAWYYIDCTWDGQTSETRNTYFLRGSGYNGYASWGGVKISAVDYAK